MPGAEFIRLCRPDEGDNRTTKAVFAEMVNYVGMEVESAAPPRQRIIKGKEQDDPKKEVKAVLKRVKKTARGDSLRCVCKRGCLEAFNAKEVMYRRMHLAAKGQSRRSDDLMVQINGCLVKVGNHSDYEWAAGNRSVCREFFAHYMYTSPTTLQNLCDRAKAGSGMIGTQNKHGNLGKVRPGKGREDAASWLQELFQDVAQQRPDKTISRGGETRAVEFLPSTIFSTLGSVYDHYKEEHSGDNTVSFPTFRRAWLQQHFQVNGSVGAPNPFPSPGNGALSKGEIVLSSTVTSR